jgi:predicted transcriptional regulator of viral defense system
MSSIYTIKIVSRLKELNVRVVTAGSLSKIFQIDNRNTVYKIIERMEKYNLLDRLIKGKYILSDLKMSDFEKANIVLTPSYISLESALSFYGILPQFTYSITSVTTQKSKKFKIQGKEYEYTKISKDFFSDYVKSDGFLIATPEKALIDLMYFASKKLRKVEFSDLDMSIINWDLFNKLRFKIDYIPFQNYLEQNKLL